MQQFEEFRRKNYPEKPMNAVIKEYHGIFCELEFNGMIFDSGPQADSQTALEESCKMALLYYDLLHNEPVVESKAHKESVSLLYNYCQSNNLDCEYTLLQESRTDGYIFQLIVNGKEFVGKDAKKKQAKEIAAHVI